MMKPSRRSIRNTHLAETGMRLGLGAARLMFLTALGFAVATTFSSCGPLLFETKIVHLPSGCQVLKVPEEWLVPEDPIGLVKANFANGFELRKMGDEIAI